MAKERLGRGARLMPRLNFIVEGQTEQTFANRLLKNYLAESGVFMQKPVLAAHGKKKGRVHRDGMGSYQAFKRDLLVWLKQDRSADAYFTTMIDLYGLPRSFPGYEEAARIADPYQRVAALEKALSDDLGDPRFIAYIQLHEFEALLLAGPEAWSVYYGAHSRQIDNLQHLCAKYASPELIDDGEQTSPSKRTGEEIADYLPQKRTAGPIIAERIGIQTMRQKCPHFDQWLRKLEELGTSTASTNR